MEYILTPKSELLLYLTKQGLLIANKSFNFFQDYNLLNETLHQINDQDYNIFKFIYHFRNNIHALLYECDQTIKIDELKLKFDFEELFYLDLLINENEEIINYSYDFDLLINFYNFIILKNEASNYFIYKIAIMRAFLTLIKNFSDSDNYNEDINEEKIDKIKNEVETEFNKYIDKFKEVFNINEDIREMKLDNLYSIILISLIKSNKFNDYNYLYNIFHEMELEKIDIGNIIFKDLQETLKENNDYMKKFIIKTEEDLYDEKKINFYYLLFKFILKNEFFIYQISLLLETKKIIIELIKFKKIKNSKIKHLSNETIERFKYVLEIFAGSKYYFEQHKKEINKLETVLEYYKLYYFETKVEDIEKIEQDIKNKNEDSEYLKDYEEANKKINFYPIIEKIYITSDNEGINSEKSLQDSYNNFITLYKLIKDRKFNKMRINNNFSQFFKDKNNYELLLEAFTKEEIDSFINYLNLPKKQEKLSDENENLSTFYKYNNKSDIFKQYKKILYITNNYSIKPKNEIISINEGQNNKTQEDKNSDNQKQIKLEYVNIDDYMDWVKEILNKSLIEIKTNKEKKEIEYKRISYGDNNSIIQKDEFSELLNKLDEKNGLKIFFKEVENKIKTEFNHNFSLKFYIELKNEGKNNIEATYIFYDPKNEKDKLSFYKDENILINGTESNLQGFNFMINEINQEKYKDLEYPEKKDLNLSKKANDDQIIEIIDIIENKNGDNGFIKEINKEYFIYVRSDNIIILIDVQFNQVMKINDYENNKILNVIEFFREKENIPENKETSKENEKLKKSKKTDELKIAVFCNNYFFITKINLKEEKTETKKYDINNIFWFSSLEFKKNTEFIKNQISSKKYFNSIRINENIIALSSNSNIPGGSDVIEFSYLKNKKYIQKKISDYSFIVSTNGLELMPKLKKENKFKILLCACKNYKKEQKNGILLVIINMEENIDIKNTFCDTENFEVYCFCPLLYDEDGNNNETRNIVESNYFLVGGFDTYLGEGKILLYKINYEEKIDNTTIEYKQEIVFKARDDMDAFNGPINCITQSTKTGHILVSCSDGNIYLLTPPNISYYLNEDEEEEEIYLYC